MKEISVSVSDEKKISKKNFKNSTINQTLKFKKSNKYFSNKTIIKVIFIIFSSIVLRIKSFRNKMKMFYKQILKNNNKNSNYFACFCSLTRMENKYSRELISYYSKLGVEKFIFGDNNVNGTQKLKEVIQDYVDEGLVDIYEAFGSDISQGEWFKLGMKNIKKNVNGFYFLILTNI